MTGACGLPKELQNAWEQSTESFPALDDTRMENLVTLVLVYVAVGAALFAHPASPAMPDDFHWRSQLGVFRASLPDVLGWPLALWRLGRTDKGRD